jgi:hypothetical protein
VADAPNPRNWPDFISYFVWGGLIFACAFFVIDYVLQEQYGRAFIAFLLGMGLGVMALHWKQVSPNWVIPVAITVLLVVALSPYFEQRRWPLAWLIASLPSSPSTQEIAAAVTNAIRPELDSLKQTNVRPSPPAPSAQDIATTLAPVIKSETDDMKKLLRGEITPSAGTPTPAGQASPYVNPIHDELVKLRIGRDLILWSQKDNQKCKATIVRYQ